MDLEKLKEAIRASGYKQDYIANCIGISPKCLSERVNGKVKWKTEEAKKFCRVLRLSKKDMHSIFFSEKGE